MVLLPLRFPRLCCTSVQRLRLSIKDRPDDLVIPALAR